MILAEDPDALWFHVVRDATKATLHGVLRSLDEAISLLSNPYRLSGYLARGKAIEPRAKTIAFHVCILNHDATVSIHRTLDYVPGRRRTSSSTLRPRRRRSRSRSLTAGVDRAPTVRGPGLAGCACRRAAVLSAPAADSASAPRASSTGSDECPPTSAS